MKTTFIASHSMEIGGAERSLLGLLNEIGYTNYTVDLFLYRHAGVFMDLIPEQINLLPENGRYASLAVPMLQALKSKNYTMVGGVFLGK